MSKLNYDIDAILTGEKQAWDKTVPSFTNEYETGFAGGRTLDQIRQLGAGLRQISISPGDNIQNAINKLNEDGNGGLVTLLPGNHDVDYDITLYSNITLQGLNAGASTIDFNSANFSILAKGSNAYTTGTISVTQGATTVTGSGTSWSSNITAGQNILISGIWYTITNVASDTSLSIAIPFASPTVSGGTYTVATTKSGIVIRELTVQFATGVGIDMQYNDNCNIEHVNIIGCGTGFRSQQASLSTVIDVVSIASGAGLVFNDSNLFQMQSSGALDTSSGIGVSLTSVTNADIGSLFAFNSSSDGIQMTNCENAAITATSIGNGGQGIEFVSGNKNIQLIAAAEDNTSDGLKLTATNDENIITSGSYANNGGYGINIAAGTCDDNLIVSNVFSSNSSGPVNDSGTGTVIRGNVGVDDNSTGVNQFVNQFTAGAYSPTINAGEAVMIYTDGRIYPIAHQSTTDFDQRQRFIGFANEEITAGSTGGVVTFGVNSNLSSLSAGSIYRLQSASNTAEISENNTGSNITLDSERWQSFTVGGSAISLIGIGIVGTSSGFTGTVKIYAGEGTGGTLMYSASHTFSAATPATVSFNYPVALAASTQYTLSVTATGSEVWSQDAGGDPYAGGRASTGASDDFGFYIYKDDGTGLGQIGTSGSNSIVGIGTSSTSLIIRHDDALV